VDRAEPYVDRRQLAGTLGVSVRTVDRLVAKGAPSELWGTRSRRFRVSEVMSWSRARGETAVADANAEDGHDPPAHDEHGADSRGRFQTKRHEMASDVRSDLGTDDDDAALQLLLGLVAEANRWHCTCGVCEALRTIASNAEMKRNWSLLRA
jgi:hypothetical protein